MLQPSAWVVAPCSSQGAIYDRPIAGFTCSDKYCNSPAASLGCRHRLINRVFSRCRQPTRLGQKFWVATKVYLCQLGAPFAVPLLLLLVGVCLCVSACQTLPYPEIQLAYAPLPPSAQRKLDHRSAFINKCCQSEPELKFQLELQLELELELERLLMANKVCAKFSAFSFLFSAFPLSVCSSHYTPLSATCWAVSCFAQSLLLLSPKLKLSTDTHNMSNIECDKNATTEGERTASCIETVMAHQTPRAKSLMNSHSSPRSIEPSWEKLLRFSLV